MELRQLRYFVEVARELNFTRAAGKLRVAQPALSRQIRQLEEELEVTLFERDHRHVRLTRAGESFLREAEALLEQSERARQSARAASTHSVLNIAYVWGLFHTLVPPLIGNFRKSHPDCAVNLLDMSAVEQSKALRTGRIDAGFIGFGHEPDEAGLARKKVGECRWSVVLPRNHPLAASRKVDLQKLSGETFLTISEEHFPGAAIFIQKACAAAGFRPRTLQIAERGHTILSLVASGCGVALLPEPLSALPREGVVFLPVARELRCDLFIAWRAPERASPLADFLNAL